VPLICDVCAHTAANVKRRTNAILVSLLIFLYPFV
jgi:hypothetical protein